jgi:hypothetical protein
MPEACRPAGWPVHGGPISRASRRRLSGSRDYMMTARAITRTGIVGAAFAAIALIPIPYLASPRWQVWVVDGSGAPVEGMTVRLVYQNYSTEAEGHEEDQTTGKQGYVALPAHRSSASVTRRCIFTLISALAGVHASFGPHAYVFAFGKGMEGHAVSGRYIVNWRGSPADIETRITARPLNNSSQ